MRVLPSACAGLWLCPDEGAYRLLVQFCGVLGARLPRFVLEGADVRVWTVCVASLVFPAKEEAPRRRPPVVERTLTTAANLAKLLPTGTFLAFQSLNPSFSNRGTCCAANRYHTLALITSCALSCAFFSFTDTVLGPGDKLYVGVATFNGFYLFNRQPGQPEDEEEEERELRAADLRELRIRWVDYVHAFFSVMVFLALALSDSNVQSCLSESPGRDTREYPVNLPLGAGFLASVVFMVLPTCRRGIGYSDMAPRALRAYKGGGHTAAAGADASGKPPKTLVDGRLLKDPMLQV
ncbi:hypothetical protein Taro_006153 [Colocasia esculenta]|uniref:Uncharacterized protein n=1 Tax=Colocasia esculenta TaxID=4460 RepID=A0A843TWS1_COLES|nr:hypothetical protein [Colocasia esculenta]